ncbi:uncharacterized protein BP5553_05372 [Venustampulla echinocandica]|uniref:Methionyl-tRNA formyltransferase n=1 Tax=Venustampulla echinocandica TaxID=2656787 RepID=A0A370TQZ0_9HELO|nr:uncharacterized protein BP5553_05372 [Venustampulla echinocandica]RDL37939.1 hypothetical protein BP5553_05372 [Venustampulla echinocandica]
MLTLLVPIKGVAQSLGLPVHEADTFRGWNLPRPQNEAINLIIAVSFGLFIPPRILKAAEYGGLNVHPSLLPNFRGPAPLHHMIMAGEKTTGFTVQTLDHKSFDHGVILAQTPPPGLPIPLADKCTYDDLLQFVKPRASDMLIQTLRDRAFVPPLVETGGYKFEDLKHAPKITPEDRHVRWDEWDAATIYRRHRALQRLWNRVWVDGKTEKRIIFEDLESVPVTENYFPPGITDIADELKLSYRNQERDEQLPLEYVVFSTADGEKKPLFYAPDGDAIIVLSDSHQALRVKNITVEGQKMKPARRVMQAIGRSGAWQLALDPKGGNQVPSVQLVENVQQN